MYNTIQTIKQVDVISTYSLILICLIFLLWKNIVKKIMTILYYVVLPDYVDDKILPGGDSSNASVLLWVFPIQTTPKEEWKEMEVGTCTDDRTAQQAGCTAVATRSIGWKGTSWDLIAKTHMRCITYILLHYIWKINVNMQDVYHRALLPFQSNTWKKKHDIEIHSSSKIIFLTIFFHSKNIKRTSINE